MAAVVAAILLVTLFPVPGSTQRLPASCLVCGVRGVADIAANILLFLPFGWVLAARRISASRAVLLGLILSSAIELLQFHTPGRYPSLSDLVFNALGAGLGARSFHRKEQWLQPARARGTAFAVATAVGALALLGAGALLLSPSSGRGEYVAVWAPRHEHPAYHYPGRVLAARIGAVDIRPGRIERSDEVRTALIGGSPIRISVTSGVPRLGWMPILEVTDGDEREVVAIGVRGDDVVFRFRTRSALLRLDQPELRLRDALRQQSPDKQVDIRVWRRENGYCIAVDRLHDCSLGFTVGDTWSLLLFPEGLAPTTERIAGIAWLVALFVPAGYWLRTGLEWSLVAPLTALGLIAIPHLADILSTPTSEVAAGTLGLLLGWVIHRLARRSLPVVPAVQSTAVAHGKPRQAPR